MAANIKIVGSILDTTTVSRYDSVDTNLIPSKKLIENFGGESDYIEYYVYDIAGNLLNINYNYLSYKLPSSTSLQPGSSAPPNTRDRIQTEDVGIVSTLSTPTSSLYPIIEIDPVKDLQDLGYSSGEFKVRYNLFQNIISNYIGEELFIKEISQDRTELRLGSVILTDEEIESTVTSLIREIDTSDYYVDYLLNFGGNNQVTAVNVALNKAPEGYEVLFKLYKQLPLEIQEKATLWVVEEKVNPYVFDINLDKLIIPAAGPTLRGPNFDITIPNQGTVSTTYTDYSTSLISLQSLQSSSYSQILNLMNTQSIQINVDYTDFNNFVFFGSAYQRTSNFYTKVKQIEDYTNLINKYTSTTSTTSSLRNEINLYSSSINTIISQFDGYESYLYFESSSYSWPKSDSIKPYNLLSTGSAIVISWYNNLITSASNYDLNNYDNLEFAVPSFIRDDGNNTQYLTFLNMVGHYFDNIWIYLKAITDINLANNNLNKGISKDLVYNQLQSLGIKLYNSQAGEALDKFLIGANTGSTIFDDNFTITGSYLNNIPRKDLTSELYKRIYHNLPLLLKTKGTKSGLENLITTFGIPSRTYTTGSVVSSSILDVKEFGGSLKSDLIKGYNTDKVRVVSNTVTGSVLSPILSLQTYPIYSTDFRENDSHYVDISFSPETQMDTYISGAIASNNSSWSLDDYIGDPRQQYNNSYSDLDTQRKLYFETGVPGFAPFTGSLLDYNGFIRLIQFFDNALFKMLGDFVPERTSLSTGVTIVSPVLERNKVSYANPTNTTTQSIYTAQYPASTINSQYGNFYDALSLSNNTMGWFDGELNGSTVNVYQYFTDNYNPYLQPTGTIDQNAFAHSDWNVLLNNVFTSVLSIKRKKIEYTGNFLPTSSLVNDAELQDSYLSLRSYNTSRYEGSKLTSKVYNVYTTSSYTGSDGRTIQTGDISYGKTAAVDRQSYKVGWVKNIPSQSLNFYDKTQIQLKYLVDKAQNITDLTLKNNNLAEVQNTFKSGDNVVLSLSDAIKPSFQKTLDGTKSIFRGGYSFDPILYRENNEALTFRQFTYRATTSFAGIKRYITTTGAGFNVGDNIYSNSQTSPPSPTTPVDNPVADLPTSKGWTWYYDGENNIAFPMATSTNGTLTRNQYISTYANTLATYPATRFDFTGCSFPRKVYTFAAGGGQTLAQPTMNFISDTSVGSVSIQVVPSTTQLNPTYAFPPGPTYTFDFNDDIKRAYVFDWLQFPDSSSAVGGFNTEELDVTGNGLYLYKAPRASTYTVSASISFQYQGAYFNFVDKKTQDCFNYRYNTLVLGYDLNGAPIITSKGGTRITPGQGPANPFRTPYYTNGYGFKVFGVLEKNPSPVNNPNNWTYVASTRLSIPAYQLGNPSFDTNRNIIYFPPLLGNGTFDDFESPNNHKIAVNMYLYDDATNPNPSQVKVTLAQDECLRLRFYFLDLDQFFSFGGNAAIEFGKPKLSTTSPTSLYTNIPGNGLNALPDSFISIVDENNTIINYDNILTISLNNMFSTMGNNIILSPELEGIITSGSIFEPSLLTSTVGYYSNVIDNTTIQPQDLIRLGPIENPQPEYYTVLSTNKSIVTYTFPNQLNFNSITSGGGFQINYPTQEIIDFFSNISVSSNKTFIISNQTSTPSLNGTYIMRKHYIAGQTNPYIVISSAWIRIYTTSTIQLSVTGRWATFTQAAISTTPTFNIVVDRIIPSNGGNPSQNFAVLRPKPDETSVVINYRKSLGDVSQTILIPQDANDEIKNSVGTIFQSLNVDLSNQNQTNTP